MGRFDNVKVGDQLERPRESLSRKRQMMPEIKVVTHIWEDPVEEKRYVALAYIQRDGTIAKPDRKHTVRGLASNGWKPASRDWIAWAKSVKDDNIVLLANPLKPRWTPYREMVMAGPGHMIQDPDRLFARFDDVTVGEVWREASIWKWKLIEHDCSGIRDTEKDAIRALVSAFEAREARSETAE